MLHTRLCDLLGIAYPILSAPMGFVSGPELAAAVSNAGGLGLMSFSASPPEHLRQEIRRLRRLTDKPFGVNLLLHFPVEGHVAVCLEERPNSGPVSSANPISPSTASNAESGGQAMRRERAVSHCRERLCAEEKGI